MRPTAGPRRTSYPTSDEVSPSIRPGTLHERDPSKHRSAVTQQPSPDRHPRQLRCLKPAAPNTPTPSKSRCSVGRARSRMPRSGPSPAGLVVPGFGRSPSLATVRPGTDMSVARSPPKEPTDHLPPSLRLRSGPDGTDTLCLHRLCRHEQPRDRADPGGPGRREVKGAVRTWAVIWRQRPCIPALSRKCR